MEKRYSNGLSFLAAYTLAKGIGFPGSDTFGDPDGGGGVPSLNTFNRKVEKAIDAIDQTHTLVFSWTYELPFGHGKHFLSNSNAVVNGLAGGWQFNSIETYHSGTPISVGGGGNIPLFGEEPSQLGFEQRPDLSAHGQLQSQRGPVPKYQRVPAAECVYIWRWTAIPAEHADPGLLR